MARKGASAIQVWSQIPVASRTVEVNTKSGFSLTAGSYSVRASSSQRGSITMGTSATTGTATITSVTTTRATLGGLGQRTNDTTAYGTVPIRENEASVELTDATTVTMTRGGGSNAQPICPFEVFELV